MEHARDSRRAVRRPEGPRADRQPRAARARRSSTASSTACTARRTSARRSTSPSTAATSPATTSAASTGGCTRGPIATTSSSTRPTPTPTSRSCSTSRSRWRSRSGGVSKLEYASFLARVPRLPVAPAARPRRHHHVRRGHRRRTCRRRRSTSTCVLHTLDRAKAERPGRLRAPLAQDGRALQAARHPRADLGLLREPGRDLLEAIKPLRFLGNDLIVFHVLDPAEIDFAYEDASSFEDLESGEQMPVVPEVVRGRSTAR